MSTQHTPGPWVVVTDKHPHRLGGFHAERRIFTEWSHPQAKGPIDVVNQAVGISAESDGPARHMVSISEADARLIAAAPDLLEALEMALVWLDYEGKYDVQGIRAAIAKARGQ